MCFTAKKTRFVNIMDDLKKKKKDRASKLTA